jgi:hypothetical protein
MEPDKKKSGRGLALLASIGRKPKADKPSGMMDDDKDEPSTDDLSGSMDEGSDDMDSASMATDDLAESLGVPPDKRGDFASSFRAAVKACMDSESDSGYGSAEMPDGMSSRFGS